MFQAYLQAELDFQIPESHTLWSSVLQILQVVVAVVVVGMGAAVSSRTSR